jgi:hypothetical protein
MGLAPFHLVSGLIVPLIFAVPFRFMRPRPGRQILAPRWASLCAHHLSSIVTLIRCGALIHQAAVAMPKFPVC